MLITQCDVDYAYEHVFLLYCKNMVLCIFIGMLFEDGQWLWFLVAFLDYVRLWGFA